MNNYKYWDKYLNNIKERLKKIDKEYIQMDLHQHSNYSTDGNQSLKDIIKIARENNFDIISITDHDNVYVYDELYELLKSDKLEDLIIIPGIEYTVENDEYGSQCHILQYMINPKSEEIIKNVKESMNAYYHRTDIQFDRLKYNQALNNICKKYNIKISKKEYYRYLSIYENNIPDYATVADYITHKLLKSGSNVLELFDELEKTNELDKCLERKELKEKRYRILRDKYKEKDDSYKSPRLLLSIIGVKGVDDDYFNEYAPCGSISVNKYGQLKIEDLNDKNITIFAHPTETKIDLIPKLVKLNKSFVGIEDNSRNIYKNKEKFIKCAEKLNYIITKGSDRHFNDNLYDDINFYKVGKKDFRKIVRILNGKD